MKTEFIETTKKQFGYYKLLGEKTFGQLSEEQLFFAPNSECNSIAVIVQHLHGNMMSRWTDFLTSDGEKEWRSRDSEFENEKSSQEVIMKLWEECWACLFSALDGLKENDLDKTIYIRNQGHSVIDAIIRQLAHYPYHIGQIVYIGKIIKDNSWTSLSIPRNKSNEYNAEKFSKEKHNEHFTDEHLGKK
jgi:hypothetical protein